MTYLFGRTTKCTPSTSEGGALDVVMRLGNGVAPFGGENRRPSNQRANLKAQLRSEHFGMLRVLNPLIFGGKWRFGVRKTRILHCCFSLAVEKTNVLIVGAGPAGLSAAIKFKQLDAEIRVVLLEKGAEVGAHILSGCAFDPKALAELLPNASSICAAPLGVACSQDSFKFLTAKHAIPLPIPPAMRNDGNRIISLSKLTKWLAAEAEALGVEIYTSTAAAHLIVSPDERRVLGVKTGAVGISKALQPKGNFCDGLSIHANVTVLAEGAHGFLSEQLIKKFNLRAEASPQTYGVGIKEVWRLADSPENSANVGKVIHTVGWPLDSATYGGSFLYYGEERLLHVGLVVGLDYANPHLSPFGEFQRFKTHPFVRSILRGATCLSYGARTLNEGGFQSVPKLSVPGACIVGCSGGLLNVARIKGSHLAIKSGIVAAESLAARSKQEVGDDAAFAAFESAFKKTWAWEELRKARNIRPSFSTPFGIYGGMLYSALDAFLLKGAAPWTFKHRHADHAALSPKQNAKPIAYPKADNEFTFDVSTSVARSGTNHQEDQPIHLKLADASKPVRDHLPLYGPVESKFCPAGVYEYVANGKEQDERVKFVINAQNCLHCKTCEIKDPSQNIRWTVPEGGGGPRYENT